MPQHCLGALCLALALSQTSAFGGAPARPALTQRRLSVLAVYKELNAPVEELLGEEVVPGAPAPVAGALAPSFEAPPAQPSITPMSELVGFTLPMLGIGLASPLLSLIDSAVVGRHSAMQLAALAPATTLCDSSAYIFYFLAYTTTNFVATARARGDEAKEKRVVRNSMTISIATGVALGVALLLRCGPVLDWLAGSDAALLGADARSYTFVRALGMPAAFVFMVLQAAALGSKDWCVADAPTRRPGALALTRPHPARRLAFPFPRRGSPLPMSTCTARAGRRRRSPS